MLYKEVLFIKNLKSEFVQRISSAYVGEDYMQIMVPHLKGAISILNASEMIYYAKPNSDLQVNQYISDSRKNQFPYSHIPIHIQRKNGRKIEFISQIYDFNKVYIVITDNVICENYAVKDGDEALMATKYIVPRLEKSEILTRDQLEDLFNSANGGTFWLDGSKLSTNCLLSNEEILDQYKKQLALRHQAELKYSIDAGLNDYYTSLGRLTIESVPSYTLLYKHLILVFTQVVQGQSEIQGIKAINVTFVNPDHFLVETYDFPISMYTLQQLQQLEQKNLKTSKPLSKDISLLLERIRKKYKK